MTLRGVLKYPGLPAVEVTVAGDLASLQAAVGGYIEGIEMAGYPGLCNEEGYLQQLPANVRYPERRDIIVGPVILFGGTDPNGDLIGVTDAQLPEVIALLNARAVPVATVVTKGPTRVTARYPAAEHPDGPP